MSLENNTHSPEQQQNPIPEKSKIPNVTIINVVLLVGLLILYVLNFLPTSQKETLNETQSEELAEFAGIIADGAFNIAYVNSDSLMSNYKLATKMRSELEVEQRRLEGDLQRKQRSFQDDVESFQRQIQLNLITMENAQVKEQELMVRQQEIIQLNDTYTNRLMTKEMEMNRDLYQKITDLLERFNAELGYDYILGFSPGGGILHANKKHDITREILRRLNQEFDATN